jgi:undecaprenyl-diphosphatase
MLIIKAILLGLVQGITEFFPISSSAHLIIIPWLFNWTDPALTSLSFDVALHLGTLFAILAYFAGDWVRLFKAGIASLVERKIEGYPDRKLAWFIIIGTIPGGIAGVLAESKINELFHQNGTSISTGPMIAMAVILALMGSLLFFAEKYARHLRKMDNLHLKDSILIGLAQALAIFPGVSRSGSTITAGLGLGLEREAAARFSFLLSAPIIAGAGLKNLYDFLQTIGSVGNQDLILFPIGIVVAAITGFFCIRTLLRYLQRNSTLIFVYYRWGLALLVILFVILKG